VRAELKVSERRACAVLRQHRSTQRKAPRGRADEAALTADVIALARTYGRYGYRRIAALLGQAGWSVNAKRVQRIWRREGLKVPQKQPKRGRLWLNDGSCVRLRAERSNHVWSYDFVEDRTHDGRKFRMLCVIDEFTREALAIRVKRRLNSTDVLETLADLMILRGPPAYVRSDNGPEFIATTLREWIAAVGSQTEFWRRHFNAIRPHSALKYRPPAPEVVIPRGGRIVPWASAPALEGARSPNPNMALEPAMN